MTSHLIPCVHGATGKPFLGRARRCQPAAAQGGRSSSIRKPLRYQMKTPLSFTRFALATSLAAGALMASPVVFAGDVTIGFAAPLTGGSAHYGVDLKRGVELALDDANAKKLVIGGQPVHFVIDAEDDQGDPRMGSQVAQKMVDSKVVGIVGHFNSGTSIPASRIYNTAGIPMVSPTATNPTLTSQ